MSSEMSGERRALTRRAFLGRSARAGLAIPLATGGLGLLLGACGDDGEPATGPSPTGGTEAATNGRDLLGARYMTAFGFSLSFIEAMVAREEGFFEDHGLFVEILGGSGTATAMQGVLGGSVQLSRANAINTIIAIANEDAPIANIATVRQRGQFELASLSESPVESPDDLEAGMTIGIVSAGGATENLLDMMLTRQNIPLDSIQRPITGTGPAAYELAQNGELDAWIAVNTDRATIEAEGADLTAFNIYDHVAVPSDSYNTSLELVESGDERPVRFLAGIIEAIRWASDESNWEQAIRDLQVYNPDIELEPALAEMPLLVEDWLANGEEGILGLDEDLWNEGQQNMQAVGLIDQTVDLDRLIHRDAIEEARSRVG